MPQEIRTDGYVVMKVSNSGPVKAAAKSTSKKKSDKAGDFSSHLERSSASDGHSEVVETKPVASMDGILSLQEVPDASEDEKRRALYQRGEDILDRLGEIQREILSGAISVDRLQNLAQTLRARRESVEDERLQQIIDEIELRAEVEIAKWGRAR